MTLYCDSEGMGNGKWGMCSPSLASRHAVFNVPPPTPPGRCYFPDLRVICLIYLICLIIPLWLDSPPSSYPLAFLISLWAANMRRLLRALVQVKWGGEDAFLLFLRSTHSIPLPHNALQFYCCCYLIVRLVAQFWRDQTLWHGYNSGEYNIMRSSAGVFVLDCYSRLRIGLAHWTWFRFWLGIGSYLTAWLLLLGIWVCRRSCVDVIHSSNSK